MTNKLTMILIASAVAVLILSAVLWVLVPQTDQLKVSMKEEELLASGVGLYKEKKFNASLAILAQIPSGSASEAEARYYQGAAYMMLKDYDSAVEYLGQAHRLNSQDTGVLYALGVAYYKLGKIKLAKSYFAAVLEINPQDEQAKGLLDIMAKLERNSAAPPEPKLNNN